MNPFHLVAVDSTVDTLTTLSRLSVIAFFIIAFYGFYKGWWIFKPQYQQAIEIRDRQIEELQHRVTALEQQSEAWMATALKSTGIAETFAENLKKG